MNDPTPTTVPTTETDEPVSARFTLTLKDYLETFVWIYRRPDMQATNTKRVLLGALMIVPTLALAIILAAWSSGAAWRAIADWVVIGGIFGGLAGSFAGEALTRRFMLKRSLIKQLSATRGVDTSDGRFSHAARIKLTADGIENWTATVEQRRPWNTLIGLDETETLLLPRIAQGRWIIIPKRELAPEMVSKIRDVVRERLGLNS